MANKKFGGRTATRGKKAVKTNPDYNSSKSKVRIVRKSADEKKIKMADLKSRLGTGYGKRSKPTGYRTGGGF